jgi:hypothetical protein
MIAVRFTTSNDPSPNEVTWEAYRIFSEAGYEVDIEDILVQRAGADLDPTREVRKMVADDVRGGIFKTVYSYREEVSTEFTGIAWIAKIKDKQ